MKIVIVEDHALFRELLRITCARDLGHQIVGEAESGAAAIGLIRRLKPDMVLLDLVLADDLDGFTVAEHAVVESPATRLLGLSGNLDTYMLYRVEHSPLHGFVDKMTATTKVLKAAFRDLGAGRSFYSERFQEARLARQSDPHWFGRLLSPTELRILGLIGFGCDDREVGVELGISPSTAQTHRSRILQKLSIPGTPKLIAFAVQHGFSHPPSGRIQPNDHRGCVRSWGG